MSRSSPWMFSRFLTSRPTNWPSSSRSHSASSRSRNSASSCASRCERLLDLALLGLGKGDDADAAAALAAEQSADQLGDVVGLRPIAPLVVDRLSPCEWKLIGTFESSSRRRRSLSSGDWATTIGFRSGAGSCYLGHSQQPASIESGSSRS